MVFNKFVFARTVLYVFITLVTVGTVSSGNRFLFVLLLVYVPRYTAALFLSIFQSVFYNRASWNCNDDDDEDDVEFVVYDELEEDFVPDENASDVEIENVIEHDFHEESTDEDSDSQEDPPLPVDDTGIGRFYTSRDRTQWFIDPIDPVRRPAEHDVLRASGPQPDIVANPLAIFRSIMTPDIVSIIVRETNRRADEVIANADITGHRIQSWKPINATEMYAYFGLLMFAGAFGSNKQPIKEMWAPYNHAIYRATMSLTRFMYITRYIRFDNGATRATRLLTSRSAPIDDIWLMLMANLEQAYSPHQNLTVGDQLFPFRGRTRFTQYIPSKAAKYGIKVWWICDSKSHYPLKGMIYTGKGGETSENVVMKLVSMYHSSGRTVYANTQFSTLNLAAHLWSVGLSFVGAVRSNHRFVPDELRFNKRRELGSILYCYCNDAFALCSYVATKKKAVLLLSTDPYANAVVGAAKSKPQQLLDFNANKTGVDGMDEMLTTFTCKRSTNRWPLAMFFNMIDIAGLAAYIIHDEMAPKKQQIDKRRSFIVDLCAQLVRPQMEQRATNPNIIRIGHIQQALKTYGIVSINQSGVFCLDYNSSFSYNFRFQNRY